MRRLKAGLLATTLALALAGPAAAQTKRAVGQTTPRAAIATNVTAADGSTQTAYTDVITLQDANGVVAGTTATSTDIGGTVTAGGTYQQILASSTTRRGCTVQNPVGATETLNVKVGAATTVYTLTPGGTFGCSQPGGLVISDAISVTAATTGHAFTGTSQ